MSEKEMLEISRSLGVLIGTVTSMEKRVEEINKDVKEIKEQNAFAYAQDAHKKIENLIDCKKSCEVNLSKRFKDIEDSVDEYKEDKKKAKYWFGGAMFTGGMLGLTGGKGFAGLMGFLTSLFR